MIDSTIVRAHQHSAGAKGDPDRQALGRSRGRPEHKDSRHCRCFGQPHRFLLTPGQAHDLQGADALLKDTPAQAVIADKTL